MVQLSLASALFVLGAVGSALSYDNTVYLIRHGEKPDDGGQGLTEQGKERAQCIAGLFGKDSGFNIGLILAEKPQSNGDRTRPMMTVAPLSAELDLQVDDSCDRDDSDCVADAISKFADGSTANVLVCWEHDALEDIQKSMGVKKPESYPSDSFEKIFTVQDEKVQDTTSENCPGLD